MALIKGRTPALQWISDLMAFFQAEAIKVPIRYRDMVLETKDLLKDDVSGIVNTMLDFAIDSALVKYRIETSNPNLTEVLNNWLKTINVDLKSTKGVYSIPTGINALVKEYSTVRAKVSSHLVMRYFCFKQDGLEIPILMS